MEKETDSESESPEEAMYLSVKSHVYYGEVLAISWLS